jgi:hypothetical protein
MNVEFHFGCRARICSTNVGMRSGGADAWRPLTGYLFT